jgi:hypothetical protein
MPATGSAQRAHPGRLGGGPDRRDHLERHHATLSREPGKRLGGRARRPWRPGAGRHGIPSQHLLEGFLHLDGALVALGGLLGQGGQHHRIQFRGDLGVARRGRLGRLVQVPGGDRHRGAVGPRPERRGATEQLIQHTPQPIQVRAGIHRSALSLLRGQVGGRPQHRPGPGQGGGRGRLGDAEVGHLHPPIITKQHVGGLDVAVYQPLGVGGGQRRADLDRELGGPAGRQPALAVEQLGQALARHVLHHQVELFGVGAAVEHGHDVGMAQPGRGAGLPLEPLHERRVLGVGRAEHLDRDLPLQHPVGGQVHPGHPAHPEQRTQLVAPA